MACIDVRTTYEDIDNMQLVVLTTVGQIVVVCNKTFLLT